MGPILDLGKVVCKVQGPCVALVCHDHAQELSRALLAEEAYVTALLRLPNGLTGLARLHHGLIGPTRLPC